MSTKEYEIQDVCERLGLWGCLIFCYLKLCSLPANHAINYFSKLVEKGIITDECFVNDGNALLKFFGSNKRVQFVLEDDLEPDVLYITKFYNDRTNFSHFVVTMGRDKVIYDPLTDSVTAREGGAIQWRKLF